MELSEEWNIAVFVLSLAKISASVETGCCWIDQMCLDQDDEELGKVLPTIPDIFRHFDVNVLMPGGLCRCWADLGAISDLEDAVGKGQAWEDAVYCAGNKLVAHYFKRLWTRQEFNYAHRMRVMWTSPPMICRNGLRADRPHGASLSVGTRQEVVPWRRQYEHFTRLKNAMTAWLSGQNHVEVTASRSLVQEQIEKKLDMVATRLVNGQNYNTTVIQPDSLPYRIYHFICNLSMISIEDRFATKTRDYVLAIFIDLPGYEVPLGFEHRRLVNLIEDAMT